MDRPTKPAQTVNSGGGPKQTAELGQMYLPNAFWNVSKDSSTRYPMVRRPQYMGKASRRKNENRELKRTNPGQFAQSLGKTGLSGGIDPASSDPAVPVALARELAALFNAAKGTGNI